MDPSPVRHYSSGGSVVDAIDAALASAGTDLADAVAGVDQFHLGGAMTTERVADLLHVPADGRLVDIGCGIGGPARAFARRFGCTVLGIDMTPSFIDTANELTARLGLQDRVTCEVGDALALPLSDGGVDAVTILHVGMNIPDKAALMAEAARVLRPGGHWAVFDIMRVGAGDLAYPQPWASMVSDSHVVGPDDYRSAAAVAGLDVAGAVDLTQEVRSAVAAARVASGPLSLAHLMGPAFPQMFSNLLTALDAGVLAPVALHGTRQV